MLNPTTIKIAVLVIQAVKIAVKVNKKMNK
jgi:hypothetical protein